ncbi:hypothetical protein L0337_27280 [candidate division KSB1 bacterium]|nr:hypothetical protein [candidate division KSB1 bacterium]
MVPYRYKNSAGKSSVIFFIAIIAASPWRPLGQVDVRQEIKLKTIERPAPSAHMLDDEPLWAKLKNKQRYLEPQQILAYEDALRYKLGLNGIVDLEVGPDGLLYALDATDLRVYVFLADLRLMRTWSLRLGQGERASGDRPLNDRFLEKPLALACGNDEIVVVSGKGCVGRWRSDGVFMGEFSAPYSIRQVRIFSNGDLLLVTPGNRFLLHRVSPSGSEKLAFAVRDSTKTPTVKVLDRAMAAILPDGGVVVSYAYPYRLEFFDRAGNPVVTISLPSYLPQFQPKIERDAQGKILRIFRQIVAYDLQVGPDGLIYHLARVRPGQGEGGHQWDVFSVTGEFLQRFHLPYNQRLFCFSRGAVYVVGVYPNYKMEKFIISRLAGIEQAGTLQ